jgi:uridine kinase
MDSFDYTALRKFLLEPLGPKGDRCFRREVFDLQSDRPTEEKWETVRADSILIFDGVFLLRPELREHWDMSVFVRVRWDEVLRRVIARDQGWMGSPDDVRQRYITRYIPGQQLYLREANPEAFADWVIDNSDLYNPLVLRCPAS